MSSNYSDNGTPSSTTNSPSFDTRRLSISMDSRVPDDDSSSVQSIKGGRVPQADAVANQQVMRSTDDQRKRPTTQESDLSYVPHSSTSFTSLLPSTRLSNQKLNEDPGNENRVVSRSTCRDVHTNSEEQSVLHDRTNTEHGSEYGEFANASNKSRIETGKRMPMIREVDEVFSVSMLRQMRDAESLHIPSPFRSENARNFHFRPPPLLRERHHRSASVSTPRMTSTPMSAVSIGDANVSQFLHDAQCNKMVEELGTLIMEMKFARSGLWKMQKKHVDRQVVAIAEAWDEIDEAWRKFHETKSREYASVAELRSKLVEEKKKVTAADKSEMITALEAEVKELKKKVDDQAQTTSKLRVRNQFLEEKVKINDAEQTRLLKSVNELKFSLAKLQAEKSSLRLELKAAKEENAKAETTKAEAVAAAKKFADKSQEQDKAKNVDEQAQTTSKLRVRNQFLEEKVKANNAEQTRLLKSVNELKSSLAKSQAEKSLLRLELEALKNGDLLKDRKRVSWSKNLTSSSTAAVSNTASRSQLIGVKRKNFMGMQLTKFEVTSRGDEYTFSSGLRSVVCTELKCFCQLYEWNSQNFSWLSNQERQQIEVNYFARENVLRIRARDGHIITLFNNKQLEVRWNDGGDNTVLMPTGGRLESYAPRDDTEDAIFELVEDGTRYRWNASMEMTEVTDVEPNYCSTHGENRIWVINGSHQIDGTDFTLRHFITVGYIKVEFESVGIQIRVCATCKYFDARHILSIVGGTKEKHLCCKIGECEHLNS